MTTPEIGLSVDDLRTHATKLDSIAGEIDELRRAAEVTRPGTDAYGYLCMQVPILLGLLQSPLTDAIAGAAQSMRATAETVRVLAEGNDQVNLEAEEGVDQAGAWP